MRQRLDPVNPIRGMDWAGLDPLERGPPKITPSFFFFARKPFVYLHHKSTKSLCIPVQNTGSSSSPSGNGSGAVKEENGTVTYQDPLDLYCDDNPETDECRSAVHALYAHSI